MEKPQSQNWFNRLFEYRAFQVGFGLVALGLAYVFIGWAVDSGSLLDYAITLLLVIVGLGELLRALRGRSRSVR